MSASEPGGGRVLLLVGLTGGIGTGKSEVDAMLESLGARVIDADRVVHDLLATDAESIRAISAVFGGGVLSPEGVVDRAALGGIVFHDSDLRAVLNKILHPPTRARIRQLIAEHRETEGSGSIVVVDAALLIESGYHREFDRAVLVTASTDRQIQRLVERDGLVREEALARIAAQWTTEAKIAYADYLIDNDGTLEATRELARALYDALLEDFAAKQAGSPLPDRHAAGDAE